MFQRLPVAADGEWCEGCEETCEPGTEAIRTEVTIPALAGAPFSRERRIALWWHVECHAVAVVTAKEAAEREAARLGVEVATWTLERELALSASECGAMRDRVHA